MSDDGFASGLWKNVEAIKLGSDGGIEAPVRTDGKNGIVLGLNAVAKSESTSGSEGSSSGACRSLLSRLLRRR